MKRIAVVANTTKPNARRVLRRLGRTAKRLGMQVFTDEATGDLLRYGRVLPTARLFDRVDAVMALGGDGTMLRTVRELDGRDRPVIGVNIGGLGFMTSVAEGDLERALVCLAKGRYSTSRRTIVEGAVRSRGRVKGRFRALNDVVITSASLRVVTLAVAVNGEPVNSYVCDGVIVSTPTGSTGHSLSAGGPILSPDSPVFVISLICPHTLSSRPLVVPDSSRITVTVADCVGAVQLSADGQVGHALAEGDVVHIAKRRRGVRFIHLSDYTYFGVLRQKLNWKGSNVR